MTTATPTRDDAAVSSQDAVSQKPGDLDEVMLAMDIVDTLRHRERLVNKELGAEAREVALITRLKEIYHAQGIDVPDRILRDGVAALEEKRFVYEPPQKGFNVSLAKFYVSRDRWMKPLIALLGIAAFGAGVYQFGYEAPRAAKIEQTRIELSQTLPASLSTERDAALAIAETDAARARIETIYQDGEQARAAGDAKPARAAVEALEQIQTDLAKELTVRVISRPGEMSGVFRVHDDFDNVKNFYLIVEAVDGRGRAATLEISSEEDQATKRVDKWGVRVPEEVFNRVAADKRDDQIIQNAVIGEKAKGALLPTYTISTAGGAILEW